MTNITKAAQDALESTGDRALLFELLSLYDQRSPLRERPELWERVRAALQDKAGEVAVAIDKLHNERRDGMTNAIFPPVQIGTRLFAAPPAQVVPDGFAIVPVEPTDEMEAEAENHYESSGSPFPDWKAAYRAMIAASQQKGGSAG